MPHGLIVGRSGSGKTTLTKRLVSLTARALVLDREWEYDIPGADTCYSFADAADVFMEKRGDEFCIVLRPELEGDYFRMLELFAHAQRTEPHGPGVVFMEEAAAYSTVQNMDNLIHALYRAGRHYRLYLWSVVQVDTDIHRVTRSNARWIVACAGHKLSGDMQRYFPPGKVEALRAMDIEAERGRFTDTPIQDVHFAVYPPTVKLYESFVDAHGYLLTET